MQHSPLLFEFPEPRACWQRILPYALLLSITLGLYASALYFDFIWDDIYYVIRDFRIRSLSWNYLASIWGGTYLGHYAPVHNTFLALLFHFFGLESFGYHLGQVLLHAACICLVYLLLKKLEAPRVALLRFRERERWVDGLLVGVFLVLSVLAKINTVVAPVIFLLYDYKRGFPFKKSRLVSLGCFFLVSATFTLIHLVSFHGSPQDLERSYGGGLLDHWQNIPFLLWFYVRMAIVPHPLSAAQSIRMYNQFDWNQIGLNFLIVGPLLWFVIMLVAGNHMTEKVDVEIK